MPQEHHSRRSSGPSIRCALPNCTATWWATVQEPTPRVGGLFLVGGMQMRGWKRNRIVSMAVVAAACVIVAGCTPLHLTTPEGSGQVRYRDAIFSAVDKTTGVTFGQAADLD